MKKIGVITLNGNYNFGNRLQNYAMIEVLKKYTNCVENIWVADKEKYKKRNKKIIFPKTHDDRRFNMFCDFTKKYINNRNIETTNNINTDEYDYFVVGSDQVWNPTFGFFDHTRMFLNFSKDKNKNIAYAASIGIAEIPTEHIDAFKNGFDSFKALSVREENAKRIIEELNERRDTEVVIDPTLVLPSESWDKIAKKPKGLNKNDKFILTCFLGEFSKEHRDEVYEIAEKNNWKVINLMDESDPFYCSGPREFVYLEKNAEVVLTDSFHSCVFATIYNRPFVIYDRITEGMAPMNARTDSLIKTFELKDRVFNGKLTKENLVCDYSRANELLEKEQAKALDFIERALDIN